MGKNMIKERKFEKAYICKCNNIRRTSRAVTKFYEQIMEPGGVKATQFTLLTIINRYSHITMSGLSEVSNLERTTLVRNLKVLCQKGWIVTEKKDSRVNIIQLTEKGQDTFEKAGVYWEQAQQKIEQILTDNEMNMFNEILRKLEDSVSK